MSRSRTAPASRRRFRRSSILSNSDRGYTRIEDGDNFVAALRAVAYLNRHQQPIVAIAVIPDVSSVITGHPPRSRPPGGYVLSQMQNRTLSPVDFTKLRSTIE